MVGVHEGDSLNKTWPQQSKAYLLHYAIPITHVIPTSHCLIAGQNIAAMHAELSKTQASQQLHARPLHVIANCVEDHCKTMLPQQCCQLAKQRVKT